MPGKGSGSCSGRTLSPSCSVFLLRSERIPRYSPFSPFLLLFFYTGSQASAAIRVIRPSTFAPTT
ncbi:MAG: hypothetical protein E7425_06080 [Ruminococcaceae bacterium]|nr:hypothetical protein [Oscillospiraceae bacterium]